MSKSSSIHLRGAKYAGVRVLPTREPPKQSLPAFSTPHFPLTPHPRTVPCPHTQQKLLCPGSPPASRCHPGPLDSSSCCWLFAPGMHSLFQSCSSSQVTLVPIGCSGSRSAQQTRHRFAPSTRHSSPCTHPDPCCGGKDSRWTTPQSTFFASPGPRAELLPLFETLPLLQDQAPATLFREALHNVPRARLATQSACRAHGPCSCSGPALTLWVVRDEDWGQILWAGTKGSAQGVEPIRQGSSGSGLRAWPELEQAG